MGTAIVVDSPPGSGGVSHPAAIPVTSMLAQNPLHLWDASATNPGDTTIQDQGTGNLVMTNTGGSKLGQKSIVTNLKCFSQRTASPGMFTLAAADIPDGSPYTFIAFGAQMTRGAVGFLLSKLFVAGRNAAPSYDPGMLVTAGGILEMAYCLAGVNTQSNGTDFSIAPVGIPTIWAVTCDGSSATNKLSFSLAGVLDQVSTAVPTPQQFGAGAYGLGSDPPNTDTGQGNAFVGEIYCAAVFLSQVPVATISGWWMSLVGAI